VASNLLGAKVFSVKSTRALAQESELLGKAVEERPPARLALLLEPFGEALVEALLQPLQLG
jgi:hypothetical protein